jgi:hypothetical protein
MRYDINSGLAVDVRSKVQKLLIGLTALAFAAVIGLSVGGANAASCVSVSTSKGMLTAAQVGGNVTGDLDATGCDIGAYFNKANPGKVSNANVHDSNQYGVFVDGNMSGNLKVDVSNSEIYNIGNHVGGVFTPNGSQTGIGVYYYGSGTVGSVSGKINNNEIYEYQKGGVAVNGDKASANVSDSQVTGLDPVTFIAQNGIQFGYGASGQAMKNTVNGNSYTGPDWTSTGILVFEASNVVVNSNQVENNQSGIAIEAWCWFVDSASNNKVVGNTVVGTQYAVSVAAYSLGGYSTCDATANNNKITNNTLESESGDTGIFVGTGAYYEGTNSPEALNNKVIQNDISGFATEYDNVGDTSTKVHANSFQ